MNYPSGKTHLYFLIGDPVVHVRAAHFVNPVFESKGLDAFLVPVHVRAADLEDVIPRLAKLGNVKGIIVTIPHKEPMARLCSELGPNARQVGAVNAVRVDANGELVGDIFDGEGLVAAGKAHDIAFRGRRVLITGAGGAGRAVAFAVATEGASAIAIHNRTRARAEKLVADLNAAFPNIEATVTAGDARTVHVVVNCTSLGLHVNDPVPLDPATLAPPTEVIDIIAVRETELMQIAKGRGCKVVGGRPMVELQLDKQLSFFGEPPKIGS